MLPSSATLTRAALRSRGTTTARASTQVFHDECDLHAYTKSALNMLPRYRASSMLGPLGEYEKHQREMAYKDFTIRRDRGLVGQAMFLDLP
nr:hypothetical_protein [Leishmania donovani]